MKIHLPLRIAAAAILAFILFPVVALAADAIPSPDNIGDFLSVLWSALTSKNYLLLGSLAVVGLTYLVRKYAGAKWPVLRSDRAGVVLAFLTAVAVTLGTAAIGGAGFSWFLLAKATYSAFIAIGGYTALKKLLGFQSFAQPQAEAAAQAVRAAQKPLTVINFINGKSKSYDANGSPVDDP